MNGNSLLPTRVREDLKAKFKVDIETNPEPENSLNDVIE